MTREEATLLAVEAAAAYPPTYFTSRDTFEPHTWVVQAILEAYNKGVDEGYDGGYVDGSSDGYDRGCIKATDSTQGV